MQRGRIKALEEKRWFKLFPNDPLEVALVPSEAAETAGLIFGADDRAEKRVCTKAFVDFRGYEDNGQPVPNGLEARVELFRALPVRRRINELLSELHEAVVGGEADAASGSPGTA